ncbi:hypothetical protein [Caulobacter radicis]|uniref:hypothetical protein n=1 Tax=Caulobacter radicis TaxID=2172650 RepID=UPI001057D4FC|nr:hypothetical protein [Caulobacter radicis]
MDDARFASEWLERHGGNAGRKIRLLMLLDAAEYAAITPISTGRLHALAYLADVLSPIYGLDATRGRILKRRAGPYYPDLQSEVDRLVGLGLVDIYNLKPSAEGERLFLDAEFGIMRDRCSSILSNIYMDADFLRLREFFRALAGALGAISENILEEATQADLTWDEGSSGALIDFAEWRANNLSAPSAEILRRTAIEDIGVADEFLTASASLHLYVRYLQRSANG